MLQTTRGIVFQQLKYSESSVIAKIYTEASGLQSFLIRGVRKKNARIRSAHLQHLTLIELEANLRGNKDIQHLKSLKIAYPFKEIPFDIKKSSIVIFLNEVLNKVVREEESNPELFEFLFHAIQFLDLTEQNIALFHHFFLIKLSRFLGFFPRNNYSESKTNFDLQEGEFTSMTGPDNLIVPLPVSKYLSLLINEKFDTIGSITIPSQQRAAFLDLILNYYRLHIPGVINFKSYTILAEVFGS